MAMFLAKGLLSLVKIQVMIAASAPNPGEIRLYQFSLMMSLV
jgi:hypothetical protein